MQSPKERVDSSAKALAMLACFFLVLGMSRGSMMWLAPVFMCAGTALYRHAADGKAKLLVFAICMALALGAAGFGIGKDMAVRDNAIGARATQG